MSSTLSELQLHEATFRAFGSSCRIVSDSQSGVEAAIHRLEDLEARWSRFIPTSEISQLNQAAGEWHGLSEVSLNLVRRAQVACDRTSGVFNPLMLGQLISLGYDRSFEQLQANSQQPTSTEPAPSPQIEISGNDVRLRLGASFDPGGLGKGLAADLIARDLLDAGATWAMVSLGGDLRFAGSALASTSQRVFVADPRSDGEILGSVRVAGGAVATSSTMLKRWKQAGQQRHHLLDPRTGRPVDLDAPAARIAATVYSPLAWWADVVAKVLVIDPSIDAAQVREWDCEAVAFSPTEVISLGLPIEVDAP